MTNMESECFLIPKGDELAKLRKKLNQDEEKLEHCLGLFSNWLSYQKHLPQTYDANFIRNMIIVSKYNIQKIKKKYETNCYSRIIHSQFVKDRIITPERDLKCLEYVHIVLLPKITPDGCRVAVLKLLNMEEYNLLECVRYLNILVDYMCSKDVQLAGVIIIFDGKVVKPMHYSKLFTPSFIKCIQISIATYPVRPCKVILLSCGTFMETGINLCKKALPQKIADRVVMVKEPSELQKYYPASCLPSDYGGSSKSIKELCDDWRKCLMENEEFLRQVHQDVPTGPIPKEYEVNEDSFGIDGSFRKLNID